MSVGVIIGISLAALAVGLAVYTGIVYLMCKYDKKKIEKEEKNRVQRIHDNKNSLKESIKNNDLKLDDDNIASDSKTLKTKQHKVITTEIKNKNDVANKEKNLEL